MGSTLPPLLFAIAFAASIGVLLIGLLLIRVGRRGRRVDDHPVCRACRFDLTGAPAESDRCPECGANVGPDHPRAVVIGNRVRRTGWAIAGFAFLLVGLFATAAVVVSMGPRVDWQTAKPTWWLLHESRSPYAATRSRALDTLAIRADPNTFGSGGNAPMSADHERELIARLLEIQADRSIKWNSRWGDVIARRIEDGTLPLAQRDLFLHHLLVPLSLSVRPGIREGDPLPTSLSIDFDRGAARSKLAIRFDNADVVMVLDGVPLKTPPRQRGGSWAQASIGNAGIVTSSRVDAAALAGVVQGEHTVELRSVAHLRAGSGDGAVDLTTVPVSATTRVTVRGRDTPAVEWVTDETLRPAMEAALAACSIRLDSPTSGRLEIRMKRVGMATGLPMPVAFRTAIRQGAHTWPAGTLATSSSISMSYYLDLDGLEPGKADVVFSSDDKAATGSIDIVKAWKGELIVHDVPVTVRSVTARLVTSMPVTTRPVTTLPSGR